MRNKEFTFIVENLVRNIRLFITHFKTFLNAPDVKSIVNETLILVEGNISSNSPSKLFLRGEINGIIGYIDVFPREEPQEILIEKKTLPELQKEFIQPISGLPTKTQVMLPSPPPSTEILQPDVDINRIYLIRIFLKRNLPAEFTSIVRNFVLTY